MNPNSSPQPRKEPLFVFSGGGSGGHLFPAIAVCEELLERYDSQCRFIFLTSGRSIESKVLSDNKYATTPVPSVTSLELRKRPLRSSLRLVRSVLLARKVLKQIKPDVVIGLGGYGSLPGVLAARSLKVPIMLMEQNSDAGKANEFLARFANVICATSAGSFSNESIQKKICFTGNPVRKSIREVKRNVQTDLPKTLTILGGSQGATAINDALMSIVRSHPEIFQDWRVIHQTGQSDNSQYMKLYQQFEIDAEVAEFFQEMHSVYQQTTLAISRAGATTLAELAFLNIPAILIPYPNSVKDHQLKNAEMFATQQPAKIVHQVESQGEFCQQLVSELKLLLTASTQFAQFNSKQANSINDNAASKVVEEMLNLIPQST